MARRVLCVERKLSLLVVAMKSVYRWVLLSAFLITYSSSLHAVNWLSTRADSVMGVGQLQVLEDPAGEFDAESIIRQPDSAWLTDADATLNPSFSDSVWWVRLSLDNTGDSGVNWVFELAQPLQSYLDVHWFVSGQRVQSWQTGDRYPFNSRPLYYRGFAFPLHLEAGQSGILYARLESHDGFFDVLPFRLQTAPDFFRYQTLENLGFGLYFGVLAAMFLYNLIVWLQIKERAFRNYSFYIAFFLLWSLSFQGYMAMGPFQFAPWWINESIVITSSAVYASLVLFSLDFLKIRELAPVFYRPLLLLAVSFAIPIVFGVSGYFSLAVAVLIPQGMLVMAFLMLAAGWLSIKKQRSAVIFFVGWCFLVVSAFVFYGRVYGLVPSSWLTEHAMNIGSMIQVFVLAVALADRINQLKRQQAKDQAYILAQERNHVEALQRTVEQRTRELQAANHQLKHESITDELTGLSNRREFFRALDDAQHRVTRLGVTGALVLMDLDHFKRINDHWGHPKGDEVLQTFADLLRSAFQRSTDGLYRLGGEEFGLILQLKTTEDLPGILEHFQQVLEQARIAYPKPDQGNLTTSIGVAYIKPGMIIDPESLYAKADSALYKSKHSGRNNVRYA